MTIGVQLVEARLRLVKAAVGVLNFHYEAGPTTCADRDAAYGELDRAAMNLSEVLRDAAAP